MLSQTEIELVQGSFTLVNKDRDALTRRFYDRLFTVAPQTRMLFSGDLEKQRTMLASVMAMIAKGLKEPEKLQPYLYLLGEDHAKLGVKTEYYTVFSEVFIETVVNAADIKPDGRLEAAWRKAFGLITPEMKRATKTMGIGLQKRWA